MTNGQDTNTKAQAEPGQSPKDVAQNTNVSSTPEKDALGDSSLDEVSGGSWPYLSTSPSSGGIQGG
ncbi:hypothetical protein [Bradyrhizobium sp. cf659]|uniref:hypothetical protein n=1 Tax=Bradyrhizobium sp. cf659 TaxID=1761771 RepID=UPI0008E773FE|nr:hypothetical protein [Bradyrhizobium sp. cf659]SFK02276.1 hypothetical protein SAMN04487925_11564 [Bradyrhizobium sp. cf659]